MNDKEVDFLVKELGMDKIKATNILRKLELKQAVKFVLNNWFFDAFTHCLLNLLDFICTLFIYNILSLDFKKIPLNLFIIQSHKQTFKLSSKFSLYQVAS